MCYLEGLPDLIWQRCLLMMGRGADACAWQELRHWALQGALTACGYMQRDIFDDLKKEPVSLTQGDIMENLRQLKARTTTIHDHTTQQIKNLLDLGYPAEAIESALRLALDAPCTVNTVEQGHSSGAVLMRDHERYTEKALAARAALHQLRSVVMPRPEDKAKDSADAKLSKLDRKCPAKVSGRHMYLKKLVADGMQTGGETDKFKQVQGIVAAHGEMYAGLSWAEKATPHCSVDRRNNTHDPSTEPIGIECVPGQNPNANRRSTHGEDMI